MYSTVVSTSAGIGVLVLPSTRPNSFEPGNMLSRDSEKISRPMAATCTTIRANTEYATVTRNTRENAEPNQYLARSAIGVGLEAMASRFGMPMAKQISVIMLTMPEM